MRQRRPYKHVTPEQAQRMAELYLPPNNWSQKKIAAEMGVTQPTVREWLLRQGIDIKQPRRNVVYTSGRPFTPEEDEKLREWEGSLSYGGMGKALAELGKAEPDKYGFRGRSSIYYRLEHIRKKESQDGSSG